VEADGAASPCIGPRVPGNTYVFIFEAIRPQRTVATTYCAVAGRCLIGKPIETPADCAAMAGTLNHMAILEPTLLRG
jgi:hypothetical protein